MLTTSSVLRYRPVGSSSLTVQTSDTITIVEVLDPSLMLGVPFVLTEQWTTGQLLLTGWDASTGHVVADPAAA
jgi:hypothetical protein